MKSAHCKVAMKQKEDKLSPGYKTFIITSGEMKNKQTNKQATKKKCLFLSLSFLSLSFMCHPKLSIFRLLSSLPLSCFEKILPRSQMLSHATDTLSRISSPTEQAEDDKFPWTEPAIPFSEKKHTKLNTKGGFRFQILVNAHSSEQE